MIVYPKATMSKGEFGEILAYYVQKSREIKVEHNINIHLTDENGTETSIDTDDIFGLICAVGAVIRKFEPAILKQYEGADEYGLDIYDKRDGTRILQIDRNINEKGVKDVRFNIDIFKEFGYPVPLLDMAQHYMVNMYN